MDDHLSGTSLVTSDNGTSLGNMKYYPFGVCRNSPENFPTDKLFTGQRLDDTGLYYYGARYYDATMGRFISADTIIPNPANPQAFNRYTYCLNNPLKYVDPSGRTVYIGDYDMEYLDWIKELIEEAGGHISQCSNSIAKVYASGEYQAYDVFRNLSAKTAFMAIQMEQSEEHDVYITSSSDVSYWGSTEKSGSDYYMTLHEDMFIPGYWGLEDFEQGWEVMSQTSLYILDVSAPFNPLDFIVTTIIDLIPSVKYLNDIDPAYQYAIGNQGLAKTIADYGVSFIPGVNSLYSLIDSLCSQQAAYDAFMQATGGYPWR
jgi:RHS repeat-associated protein